MFSGETPSSNSRATRSVKTRVFPDPAFADNHVDTPGCAAWIWRRVASFICVMSDDPFAGHRLYPIRQSETVDRIPKNPPF